MPGTDVSLPDSMEQSEDSIRKHDQTLHPETTNTDFENTFSVNEKRFWIMWTVWDKDLKDQFVLPYNKFRLPFSNQVMRRKVDVAITKFLQRDEGEYKLIPNASILVQVRGEGVVRARDTIHEYENELELEVIELSCRGGKATPQIQSSRTRPWYLLAYGGLADIFKAIVHVSDLMVLCGTFDKVYNENAPGKRFITLNHQRHQTDVQIIRIPMKEYENRCRMIEKITPQLVDVQRYVFMYVVQANIVSGFRREVIRHQNFDPADQWRDVMSRPGHGRNFWDFMMPITIHMNPIDIYETLMTRNFTLPPSYLSHPPEEGETDTVTVSNSSQRLSFASRRKRRRGNSDTLNMTQEEKLLSNSIHMLNQNRKNEIRKLRKQRFEFESFTAAMSKAVIIFKLISKVFIFVLMGLVFLLMYIILFVGDGRSSEVEIFVANGTVSKSTSYSSTSEMQDIDKFGIFDFIREAAIWFHKMSCNLFLETFVKLMSIIRESLPEW